MASSDFGLKSPLACLSDIGARINEKLRSVSSTASSPRHKSLHRPLQPNREQSRRVENSLKLWVVEAKGVTAKKRYFCEVHMDDTLYARTSSKNKAQLCFWGEQFEFYSLPAINTILVKLYREADTIFKKDKTSLIGVVEIRVNTVDGKCMVDRWYSIGLGKPKKHRPSIRIKCRYQSVKILPIHVYSELLAYITERYGPLCEMLEPIVLMKSNKDIVNALVHIMQCQGLAKNFLAYLVTKDVLVIDDQRLTFRGNSLATKAAECFMRLVGDRYLTETLAEPIRCLLESGVSLEVDPLCVASPALLIKQRDNLCSYVKLIWNAILDSSPNFPTELRGCFHLICDELKSAGQEHQQENTISSCIFLRFFCPAILTPSLFNITCEYPDNKNMRNLTLVAKTLQTLANFTLFKAKENYLEFLNDFVLEETASMHFFLHNISRPLSCAAIASCQPWDGYVDLGLHLSVVHSLLCDCLPAMCETATEKSPVERQLLEHALNSVTAALDEPNVALVYQQPPTPTAAGPPTMPGMHSLSYQDSPAPSHGARRPRNSSGGVLSSPDSNVVDQRRTLYDAQGRYCTFGSNVYYSPLTVSTLAEDHPDILRSSKYSPSSSLSSSMSSDDVRLTVHHRPRCPSSSSTSPHRCLMPPIFVDGNTPPVESEAGLVRSRWAKAYARCASIDALTSNRCQYDSLSDSSSDPPVSAMDNGAAAAAARDVRPRHKHRRLQRQHQYESYEEYDDEIRRLRAQMEALQNRIDRRRSSLVNAAVLLPVPARAQSPCATADQQPPSDQMAEVLSRLSQVEKELRHGQSQVSSALEERDRVIQTQNRRIQELNNNNQELKEMLHRIANNRSDTSDSPATGESKSSDNNVSDTSDCRSGSR